MDFWFGVDRNSMSFPCQICFPLRHEKVSFHWTQRLSFSFMQQRLESSTPISTRFPATATSHWDKLGGESRTVERTIYIHSNYPDWKSYGVENTSNSYFPSAIRKEITNLKPLHRPEQELHFPTAFELRCGLCLSSAQDHSMCNVCHFWVPSSERSRMHTLASSSSFLPARM